MKILGIDYGRKKIGLAISESSLAEPLSVIRFDTFDKAIEKIKAIIDSEKVGRIVLGVSEGLMAKEEKEFGLKLSDQVKIPLTLQDETLTTHDAQELSIKAGIKRKKRRAMEDAYSAALILQNYLDSF